MLFNLVESSSVVIYKQRAVIYNVEIPVSLDLKDRLGDHSSPRMELHPNLNWVGKSDLQPSRFNQMSTPRKNRGY